MQLFCLRMLQLAETTNRALQTEDELARDINVWQVIISSQSFVEDNSTSIIAKPSQNPAKDGTLLFCSWCK